MQIFIFVFTLYYHFQSSFSEYKVDASKASFPYIQGPPLIPCIVMSPGKENPPDAWEHPSIHYLP